MPLASISGLPEVTRFYDEEPELLIKAISLAACEVAHDQLGPGEIHHVQARIISQGPPIPFSELKAALIGKFVRVSGSVTRVSSIRPRLAQVSFSCNKCFGRFTAKMPDGVYRVPFRCQVPNCGGPGAKCLTPDRSHPDTQCTSWQQIRLQESIADDEETGADPEQARVPRSMDVELEGASLVDTVAPGDTVIVGAIVKAADVAEGKAHVGSTYVVYLAANWLRRTRDQADAQVSDDAVLNIISSTKELLPLLVASFCPQIYGHALPKFGLLLTLFGGTRRADKSFPVRSDPHMLLVGDPGLGKSQLVRAAAAVAPRGLYVCGQTSTATGLTATLQHDGGGGGGSAAGGLGGSAYSLEAGAMVLADGGVCCIDEFDKAQQQHRVLLQVMEQQCVSIAKAGVVCSLPARTSVIAAANPVGGHYTRTKGLLANLKMEPALLSRFDLVFVLLDRPDKHLDRVLSEQVLGSFCKSTAIRSLDDGDPRGNSHEASALLERLSFSAKEKEISLLSAPELRRYIAFCREHVHPRMGPEASSLLQSFYLELRQAHHSTTNEDDLLPITTRHLEAMIRLCEARARMELRTLVEPSDAQDIIQLVRYCMNSHRIHDSDPAMHQAKRAKNGTGRSALVKRFVAELIRIASATGQSTFTEQQLRDLHETLQMAMHLPFTDCIEALNQYGYILKKAQGLYKLVVT